MHPGISMGKLKAAKVLQGVAAECIQMFGGWGL